MSNKINFSFNVDGIGPHYSENKVSDSLCASAPHIAIYAENGTGKTFFARMFALAEKGVSTEDIDRLISIGKTKGEFCFSIKNSNVDYDYTVSLEKGKEPSIQQCGKTYLYHVFNSDYIRDNIASVDFSPNGDDVTGYILGKDNIDVSEEKEQLENINNKIQTKTENINEILNIAREELSNKKINASMSEYKELNLQNIFIEKFTDENEDYSSLCAQLDLVKKTPDNIPDFIERLAEINCEVLIRIEEILHTKYNKVHFDASAMEKIQQMRNDVSFFQKGISLFENIEENICPFCNQELSEIGIRYIKLYKHFFEQEESNIIAEIDQQIRSVEKLNKSINDFEKKYLSMSEQFMRYRIYIPEMNKNFPQILPKNDMVIQCIEHIKTQLNIKKSDIECCDFDIDKDIDIIKEYISTINLYYKDLLERCKKLHKLLDDSNKSRVAISRRICNSKRNEVINSCKELIEDIKQLTVEVSSLESSIKEKEDKVKTSKREKVAKSLSSFLDYFFHKKYEFDEQTFTIRFKGESLDKRAKDVLSDGEKSIVAFCYFLASTHLLVNRESDYDDLFFIMDDPISSMDFHYVYAVADIIRHINIYFPQIKKIRYIVFTHNAEFMGVLCRNKIVNLSISMTKGHLQKMNSELLMPYEHHLNDIVCVANGKAKPNHTIPNSIRQVIETIMRFETPKKHSTEEYIQSNELLRKNAYIYSLMQERSHGAVRKILPISEDLLKEACTVVVQFVKSKYPEQVE